MPSNSDTFHCPHCGVSLTKSAAASILGQVGGFAGHVPPSVTCPGCGGDIDTRKMIAGDYDMGASPIAFLLSAIGFVAATLWLRSATGFNWFFSAGIVWGALIALGLGWLAAKKAAGSMRRQ